MRFIDTLNSFKNKIYGKNKQITMTKEYCYNCRQDTNQILLLDKICKHSESLINTDPVAYYSTYTLYKVYKCAGCEHISLTRWRYNSDHDFYLDHDTIKPEYFPPRTFRDIPYWYDELDDKYKEILNEIYISLANKTNRLTLMGCRTIIDMYLNSEIGDNGSFQKKLNTLLTKKLISEPNKKIISIAIDAGNAASHRAYSPDDNTLITVVNIIENLLEQLVLRKGATMVEDETPQRDNQSLNES